MEEQSMLNISITWRKKQLNVEINSNSSCKEFGQKLQKLTNVRPETMRLLLPRSGDKASKLLTPFSDEHSSLSLREASVVEGKPIRMMGVFEEEIEEVSLNSTKPDLRIAGFDEEEKRLRQRLLPGPQSSLKLPQGTYIFCEFRTLQIPGIELNPPASEALKRMHRLASDPGIIAIMNKHQWRVGIMTEMAPVGYVGITPKCILGFNKNHGEEISLRLRTDDLKGFRKYESIKETLLHELAHMVYSEHDADFYALDRQLNQEAASLDWTKSTSHTLSGLRRTYHHEEEDFHVGTVRSAKRLGGQPVNSYTSARLSSVAAAYQRLLSASVTTSSSEPDKDDSQLKENIYTMIPLEIVGMPNCESSSYRGSDELDPDGRVEQENMVEPDPDDRVEQENMVEPDPDDRVEQENMVEPDPDDQVEQANMVEPDPDDQVYYVNTVEPDPDDQVYIVNTVEPDPDDQVVHEKRVEPDPDDQVVHEKRVEPDPDISGVVEVIMQEKNLLELGENESPVKIHEEVNPESCRPTEAFLDDRTTEEPDPDDSHTAESNRVEPVPDDGLGSFMARKPEVRNSDLLGIQNDEPDPDDAKERVLSNVGSAVSDGPLTYNNPELQRIQDPVADICMRLQKAIQMLRSEATPTEAVLALQTLAKIIRNVIEHPDEMKFRRLRKANSLFQRNVLNYKAAMEVLSIVGFHEDVMSDGIGRTETYMVLGRNDPGLLWLAKSSLETCTA